MHILDYSVQNAFVRAFLADFQPPIEQSAIKNAPANSLTKKP
jgi:hypothetical protein